MVMTTAVAYGYALFHERYAQELGLPVAELDQRVEATVARAADAFRRRPAGDEGDGTRRPAGPTSAVPPSPPEPCGKGV